MNWKPIDAAGRVKGVPYHWQQFFLCALFHLLWPMVPLALEFWGTGTVKVTSVTLSASMYSLSVGRSSRNILQFGVAILQSSVFAVAFGRAALAAATSVPGVAGGATQAAGATGAVSGASASSTPGAFAGSEYLAAVAMGLLLLVHLVERYNRHVVERAPFLEFLQGKEG